MRSGRNQVGHAPPSTTEITKGPGLKFSALLSEGVPERLELADA